MYMDTLRFLSENEGKKSTEIREALIINASILKGMLDLAAQRGEVDEVKNIYSITERGLQTCSGWKKYEGFLERLNYAFKSSDKNEKR